MPRALHDPLTSGRSFLFAPGHRPDLVDKARASTAAVVVVDLEDAVPVEAAPEARRMTSGLRWTRPATVRPHAPSSPEGQLDLAALDPHTALLVPKASASELEALDSAGHAGPVIALVETVDGLESARELARHPRVLRLAFGHLDLASEIGADPDDVPALLLARSLVVMASAGAGLPGPLEGVHPDFHDSDGLRASSAAARRMGFRGRLCIHPHQIEPVEQAFAPGAAEVAWARAVMAEDHDGVTRIGSQMVDAPVRARAAAILAQAREER